MICAGLININPIVGSTRKSICAHGGREVFPSAEMRPMWSKAIAVSNQAESCKVGITILEFLSFRSSEFT